MQCFLNNVSRIVFKCNSKNPFFKTNTNSHKISSEELPFNSLLEQQNYTPSFAYFWTALKTLPTDKHCRPPLRFSYLASVIAKGISATVQAISREQFLSSNYNSPWHQEHCKYVGHPPSFIQPDLLCKIVEKGCSDKWLKWLHNLAASCPHQQYSGGEGILLPDLEHIRSCKYSVKLRNHAQRFHNMFHVLSSCWYLRTPFLPSIFLPSAQTEVWMACKSKILNIYHVNIVNMREPNVICKRSCNDNKSVLFKYWMEDFLFTFTEKIDWQRYTFNSNSEVQHHITAEQRQGSLQVP